MSRIAAVYSVYLGLALACAAGCADDHEGDLLGIANAPSAGGSAGSANGGAPGSDSGGSGEAGGSTSIGGEGAQPSAMGGATMANGGAAGSPSEGGGGQASGTNACGDMTADEGEQCDDGNTLDGDGCGSDCRESCESCEAERCVDLEGSNYLEFVYENDELALDGPAAGLKKSELSQKLVRCMRQTGCFLKSYDLMGCYCGDASSNDCLAGNGTGACREAVEWAVEATDAATIVGLLEDVTLASGQVAALMKDCDLRQCGDVCLPIECEGAAHWNPHLVYQADQVAVATCLTGDCEVGKLQRFKCSAAAPETCSQLQPGVAGWDAAWTKLAECP